MNSSPPRSIVKSGLLVVLWGTEVGVLLIAVPYVDVRLDSIVRTEYSASVGDACIMRYVFGNSAVMCSCTV